MKFLYEVCYLVFSTNLISNYSYIVNTLAYFSIELVFLSQNIQFFWNPTLNFDGWETYYDFWNTINLLSIDVVVANLGYIQEFLIFELTLVGLIILVTFLIILLKICGKKPPKLLILIAKFSYYVVCEINFIPTCILTFVIFKYSGNSSGYVIEYPSQVSAKVVDFGGIGKFLSIMSALMLIVLTTLFEISRFEIWNSGLGVVGNQKISPYGNIFIKFTYFLNSYFFTTIQLTNYGKYLYIALINYSITTYIIASSVSYYSNFLNIIKIWSHLNLTSICLFFILGMELNNLCITFLLTIAMQPVILFVSYLAVLKMAKNINPASQTQDQPFKVFEISIRKHLILGDLKENLLEFMQKNLKLHENKINLVLQAYYCLHTLNDTSLAISKISQLNCSGFDIVNNYQVFKCKKILKETCKLTSKPYKLLIYFKEFDLIKSKDKLFCEDILNFFSIVIESKFSLKTFKMQVSQLADKIKELSNKYEGLMKNYPEADEVKQYYGTLLMNILNKPKKGQKLISKSLVKLDFRSPSNYFQFKGRALMVVLAENPPGKVVYYNKGLLKFLKISNEIAKDLNINQLIPELYAKGHDAKLVRFMKKALTCTVNKNSHMVILDNEGFLKECLITIECIGDGSQLFFICSIDPLEFNDRGCAFINQNGYIHEHSKNISGLLESDKSSLDGSYLSEYIQDFLPMEPENIYSHKLKVSNNAIYCITKLLTFSSTRIPLLFITRSHAEAKRWNQSALFLKQESINEQTDQEEQPNNGFQPFKGQSMNKQSLSLTQSSYSSILGKSKTVKSSLRSFKLIKLLLLISVLIFFVFSLIILVFTVEEVKQKTNSESIENLNDILNSFSRTAFLTYSLDLKKSGIIDLAYTESDLKNELDDLEAMGNYYITNKNIWSYCESIDSLTEKKIAYWKNENATTSYAGNLQNVIDTVLSSGRHYINCQSNAVCHKIATEILMVSLGNPYAALRNSINGLVKCEEDTVNNLRLNTFIVLMSGVAVFILAILFICLYIHCIENFLQDLWKTLAFSIMNRSRYFKKVVTERLIEAHNYNKKTKYNSEFHKNEIKTKNYKHYLRYLARFFILCGLSLGLYLTNRYYFCNSINDHLQDKPRILSAILNDRNSFSLLNFITLDQHLKNSNLSTINLSSFVDYNEERKQVFAGIKSNIETWTNINFSLISSKIFKEMNDRLTSSSIFLSLGTVSGMNFQIQESYFLLNQSGFQPNFTATFTKNNENLASILTNHSHSLITHSNSQISLGLRNQIIFFISTSIFLFFIYYYFYYKFIDNEIKVIHDLISVISLAPSLNYELLNSSN